MQHHHDEFCLLAMIVDYHLDLLSSLPTKTAKKYFFLRMWLPQGHDAKTLFTSISNISSFKNCFLQANDQCMKTIFILNALVKNAETVVYNNCIVKQTENQ